MASQSQQSEEKGEEGVCEDDRGGGDERGKRGDGDGGGEKGGDGGGGEKRNEGDGEKRDDKPHDNKRDDIPHDNKRDDIPHDNKRDDIPHDNKRDDIPHDNKRDDIPHDNKRDDIPHDNKRDDIPHDNKRDDIPHDNKSSDDSKPHDDDDRGKSISRAKSIARGNDSVRRIVLDTSLNRVIPAEPAVYRLDAPDLTLTVRLKLPAGLFQDGALGEVATSVRVSPWAPDFPWGSVETVAETIDRMRVTRGLEPLTESMRETVAERVSKAICWSLREFHQQLEEDETPAWTSLLVCLKEASLETKLTLVLPPHLCNRNARSPETLKVRFPLVLETTVDETAARAATSLLATLRTLWEQLEIPAASPREEEEAERWLSLLCECVVGEPREFDT